MLVKLSIVALAGAIICLDRFVLQAMISRPIVAGPVTGILLGDPVTGLVAGAFIELLWIDQLPIGTYVPPNDSLVAILITGSVILVGDQLGHMPRELVALAMLLYIPFGLVGQKINVWILQSNDALSHQALEDAAHGNIRGVSFRHMRGMVKIFFSTVCLIVILLPSGVYFLVWLFPVIPGTILKALSWIYLLIPVVGVAVALNTIKVRGAIPVFCGVFLIVLLLRQVF